MPPSRPAGDPSLTLSFAQWIERDPWLAVELPLPDDPGIDALRCAGGLACTIIHALDFTPDDSLPFIGRLAEINHRLEAAVRRSLNQILQRAA